MYRNNSLAPPSLPRADRMGAEASNVDSLIADLNCHDPLRRKDARKMLGFIGKQAVPALIASLKHPNSHMRWEAAKALEHIPDARSAQALVEALEDRDRDVRWVAAVALIALGRRSLKPLLQALNDHADSDWLRQGAHHVVHALSQSGLAAVVAPVLNALDAPEPEVAVPPAVYQTRRLLREAR